MNIYSIYTDSSNNQRDLLIIKQGFSIFALIFNFFWAIYHKMWLIAFLVTLLGIVALPLEKLDLYYLFDVAILFFFAFFASELREYYASKDGFEFSDIILADSEEEAELRYYYYKQYRART